MKKSSSARNTHKNIVSCSNDERFLAACDRIIHTEHIENGIGTLSEKTVHSVLKNYLEPDTTYHEIKTGRYVADIRTPDGIYEIQTRQFNKLRNKLEAFLPEYSVTVVYPIPHIKYLRWIDGQTGEITPAANPRKKVCFSPFSTSFTRLSRTLRTRTSICCSCSSTWRSTGFSTATVRTEKKVPPAVTVFLRLCMQVKPLCLLTIIKSLYLMSLTIALQLRILPRRVMSI